MKERLLDLLVSAIVLTGYLSAGLVGIPAVHATPNALCRVRGIKAAHITGTSDGGGGGVGGLRSVPTGCSINQRIRRKMVPGHAAVG